MSHATISPIEILETRMLLSASLTSGGTLKLIAKDGIDNDIVVSMSDDGSKVNVQVNDDSVQSFAADDVKKVLIYGGNGDDLIEFNEDARPFSINTVVHGLDGNDTLIGASGSDNFFGDQGADSIVGNDGNDVMSGCDGDDIIEGGAGADLLHGGDEADRIAGGTGNDQIFGDNNADTLFGEGGRDSIRGGKGNDDLSGGGAVDTLKGDAGVDQFNGGSSRDFIRGDSDEIGSGEDSPNEFNNDNISRKHKVFED